MRGGLAVAYPRTTYVVLSGQPCAGSRITSDVSQSLRSRVEHCMILFSLLLVFRFPFTLMITLWTAPKAVTALISYVGDTRPQNHVAKKRVLEPFTASIDAAPPSLERVRKH